MLHIGLLGHGRTGSIVARYLSRQNGISFDFVVKKTRFSGHTETPIFDRYELSKCVKKYKPDIIIDFSTKDATIANCAVMADAGYTGGVVIATTGFSDEEVEILKSYSDKFSIMLAPNISDGINILIKATKLIDSLWPDADVHIVEEHFKNKKDVSGTAVKIKNAIGKGDIISIRSGGTVGVHKVIFGCENQKIEITHQSHSRDVFAAGALRVGKWLNNMSRGFYTMEHYIDSLKESYKS